MKKINISKKIILTTIILFTLVLLTKEKESNAATYIWPIGGNNISETYVEYPYGDRTYNSSKYNLTYNYSPYEQTYNNTNTENHYGVDITGIKNHSYSIVSVSNGIVIATSENRYYNAGTNFPDQNKRLSSEDGGGYGNYVIVQEPSTGKCFLYAHLKANTITVKKGNLVSAGQVLGTMGSSGDSGHMHLHFEVRKNLNSTTVNNGGNLVYTTQYNKETEDPLLYIAKPIQAKLNKITYSYDSTKLNLFLNFDKAVTVKTAPEIIITAGSESKLATYIGTESENTRLIYEINYNVFSDYTSGQMLVRCNNGGNVITMDEFELPVNCTFGNGHLINLESPAKLSYLSYTQYSNSTKIHLNFDKEIIVNTPPTLSVTIGDKTLLLESADLSYNKKKLTYTLSYDEFNSFTCGDILVSCINNGNIITDSNLKRPVSCIFTTKKTGKLSELQIKNTFKNIIENNLGDVNNDDIVNVSDASAILSISSKIGAGDTSLESTYLSIADVNNDGSINTLDASEVLRYYLYASTHNQTELKNALSCDFNNDNQVNSTDYNLLLDAIFETNPSKIYDLNKDGFVNAKDTALFLTTLSKLGKRN